MDFKLNINEKTYSIGEFGGKQCSPVTSLCKPKFMNITSKPVVLPITQIH